MKRDAYDLVTSTDSAEAQRAFENAVFAIAAHKPNTGAGCCNATLAADPQHVGGHALKGFANLILAREELGALCGLGINRCARRACCKCRWNR